MTRSLAVEVEEDPGEPEVASPDPPGQAHHGPFENVSQARLTDHYYGRSDTHSRDDLDDIIHVITSEGFDSNDLRGFSARKAEQLLDAYRPLNGVFSGEDGWVEGTVNVPLPKTFAKYKTESDAPVYPVSDIVYRRLLDLITSVVTDAGSRFKDKYYWVGHKLFWDPSHSPQPPDPIRVFTDCYNSDAQLAEEAELRKKERVKGDEPGLEYVILPLLFWSDATALSNFGTASLWPIYVYFGNLSKYVRGRPTEFAAQHLAYIPALGDVFKEFYKGVYGKGPTDDVRRFCKRELFTQIWLLLLDDDFINAYQNGILLTCGDGVVRRVFPRIFTYSADYPEKVLALGLRQLAECPCPRCYTTRSQIRASGTKADERRRAKKREDSPWLQANILRARRFVFQGHSIASQRVTKLLNTQSLTPLQNAFSQRLSAFGVNCYELFAPDLMHEFELGVWKGVFSHLMRILAAEGADKVTEYNRRYMSTTHGCVLS
ncbi:hypothetical protein C8Q80DRAFT_1093521 [Daedaleopsis nitida]|nr:hypothetical protein C8Q80DRAFT_1093521 [Daedaleopsis nitida]